MFLFLNKENFWRLKDQCGSHISYNYNVKYELYYTYNEKNLNVSNQWLY